VKFNPGIAYSLAGLGGTHRIVGKTAESLKYYHQANEMFHSLRDTFGSAYTHCGVGNANRIMKEYGMALDHFRKATRLYEEIGDIVSYSYTLWSLAMVYKMKGDLIQAGELIGRARKNFKKTKDPRGIIYCDLADGEVAWMEGNNRKAQKLMQSALANAERHKFKLEGCHARLLLLNVVQDFRKGATAKNPPCYKKIGVDLNFDSMPFNIP
jgi:tetratricopeptide (TPR) repeat protein